MERWVFNASPLILLGKIFQDTHKILPNEWVPRIPLDANHIVRKEFWALHSPYCVSLSCISHRINSGVSWGEHHGGGVTPRRFWSKAEPVTGGEVTPAPWG